MKRLVLALIALMAFMSLSFAADTSTQAFKGQIMDAMCAVNGSHSPGGYAATHTNNPKGCTLACVKAGSTFVLYNAGEKTTLKLDGQNEARDFAGRQVSVAGTLDRATETIHVVKIKAGS